MKHKYSNVYYLLEGSEFLPQNQIDNRPYLQHTDGFLWLLLLCRKQNSDLKKSVGNKIIIKNLWFTSLMEKSMSSCKGTAWSNQHKDPPFPHPTALSAPSSKFYPTIKRFSRKKTKRRQESRVLVTYVFSPAEGKQLPEQHSLLWA